MGGGGVGGKIRFSMETKNKTSLLEVIKPRITFLDEIKQYCTTLKFHRYIVKITQL